MEVAAQVASRAPTLAAGAATLTACTCRRRAGAPGAPRGAACFCTIEATVTTARSAAGNGRESATWPASQEPTP